MKYCKVIVSGVVVLVFCFSCFFDKKQKMDAFYTTRNYGQFPIMPLVKPIKLIRNGQTKAWRIKTLNHFKKKISTRYLDNSQIGIDSIYIYGKLTTIKRQVEDYQNGDKVYMYVGGSITWTKKTKKINDNIARITSFDTITKSFIEPERWFLINVADSTIAAFFSKKKYEDYLKEKGISGKMYDINAYHKQYKATGMLPWFPDSIKVKLKNR